MAKLDLSSATATFDSGDLPTGFTSTACNTLYLINNSNLTFQVTFTGGSGQPVIGHLPNQWARVFKVNGNYDRVRVTGSDNPNNATTPAFSYLVVESYLSSEDVSHLADTPITAPTTFVGPAVVTATNLVNTGNVLGTNVITTQPVSDSNNTFTLDNAGNVTIGDAAHGGSLSVVGTATFGARIQGNGTSNLRLDSNGQSIEFDVAGIQKAFVDVNGFNINAPIYNSIGSAATNVGWQSGLNVSGGLYMNDNQIQATLNQKSLFLQAEPTSTGAVIQFGTHNVARAQVWDNGIAILSGWLALVQGTISRISIFSGSATNVFSNTAHGLGVVPDAVFFCETNTGADTTTFQWNPAGSTSTNVSVYSSAGSSPRNFIAIAIKA